MNSHCASFQLEHRKTVTLVSWNLLPGVCGQAKPLVQPRKILHRRNEGSLKITDRHYFKRPHRGHGWPGNSLGSFSGTVVFQKAGSKVSKEIRIVLQVDELNVLLS